VLCTDADASGCTLDLTHLSSVQGEQFAHYAGIRPNLFRDIRQNLFVRVGRLLVEQHPHGFARTTSVADDGDETWFHLFRPLRFVVTPRAGFAVGGGNTAVVVGLVLTPSFLPVIQSGNHGRLTANDHLAGCDPRLLLWTLIRTTLMVLEFLERIRRSAHVTLAILQQFNDPASAFHNFSVLLLQILRLKII